MVHFKICACHSFNKNQKGPSDSKGYTLIEMRTDVNAVILFTIQKNPCDYKGHTSNLGFQLDSVATLGRKVRERQGERVR